MTGDRGVGDCFTLPAFGDLLDWDGNAKAAKRSLAIVRVPCVLLLYDWHAAEEAFLGRRMRGEMCL